MEHKVDRQNNDTHFLVKIFVSLVIVFVIIQLYVLTTVGTQGQVVSDLRNQQARIKIENELKRAKILELQTDVAIQDTIENLQMRNANVQFVDSDDVQIAALTNPENALR